VWRWDQVEPFGVNVPDENPSGLGAFEFPMRLPGQYFDKETNLHYSYFRDCYDPAIGRFCQPDPIGTVLLRDMALRRLGVVGLAQPSLAGLVYSQQPKYNHPYAYVKSNPLSYADPLGLSENACTPQATSDPFPQLVTAADLPRFLGPIVT
jgi:RHS repeat-associated protein